MHQVITRTITYFWFIKKTGWPIKCDYQPYRRLVNDWFHCYRVQQYRVMPVLACSPHERLRTHQADRSICLPLVLPTEIQVHLSCGLFTLFQIWTGFKGYLLVQSNFMITGENTFVLSIIIRSGLMILTAQRHLVLSMVSYRGWSVYIHQSILSIGWFFLTI